MKANRCILKKRKKTYSHLPVVKLPSRSVPLPQISLCPDTRCHQFPLQLQTRIINRLVLSLTLTQPNRDNCDLLKGDSGRQDETLVITVDHDHDTQRTGGETPRVLVRVQSTLRLVWRLDGNVKHLGEVLSQVVGSSGLDTSARGGDETFHSGGVITTGKLFLLGLFTGDDGHSEDIFVDLSVELENVEDFLVSIGLVEEGGVAFLPEELSGTEERLRVLEFPSNDRVPLVELEREVSVRVDPLGIVWRQNCSVELPFMVHKSRNDLQGYMTVSEVGLIAMCSSRSEEPLSYRVNEIRFGADERLTPW